MDRTYIESQHIVERYLTGDLTVREARDFEKYCFENPDILKSLPIPVRVKAKMARRPGEELPTADFDPTATNTSIEAAGLHIEDDDDDDVRSYRGSGDSRTLTMVLSIALIVAIVGAGVLWFRTTEMEKQLKFSQRAVKSMQLRAPGGMREYKIAPGRSPATATTVNVGWPDPPQLIELHVDMTDGNYNLFLVTIDSVADGRAMQIRRVARDTNKELRIGLNSSAFGPGDYDLKFEGYTWRGETVPVGWMKLKLK
jgi:hypothetical protein